MTKSREFYYEFNKEVLDKYDDNIKKIEEIYLETKTLLKKDKNNEYFTYFNYVARFILHILKLEKEFDNNYFIVNSFDELLAQNNEMYNELLPENYNFSYANPEYSVSVFGDKFGQLLSYLYVEYRNYIDYAYKHKLYKINEYNELFIKTYEYIKNNDLIYDEFKDMIFSLKNSHLKRDAIIHFKEDMNVEYPFFNDIIIGSNLEDLRYLFKFGKYITNNEIQIANTLLKYSSSEINSLAKIIVDAFLRGFDTHNKDRGSRVGIRIVHIIGLERITKAIIKQIESYNLKPVVVSAESTNINNQFGYDHRYDRALYTTKEFLEKKLDAHNNALEICKDLISNIAGNIIILQFGQKSNTLKNKNECLMLSDEQSKIIGEHSLSIRKLTEKYLPRSETSYCGVAFPSPEIGDNFEEIFRDTVKINMMDSKKHEKIQQIIIDTLDKAEYVHVKGKKGNLTDIKVRLHHLNNPDKETNFSNCGADVNIPVGEVFTSPLLKDTNGTLHVKEVLIDGIKYYNLKLIFENGYIADYSCSNFDSIEENKKFIRENLILPNKTLPIGEFAIGTNTLAYVISKKHEIVDDLHTLIAEKLGPHIAVGDTCFAWAEDIPLYNIYNNKEMISRDNEKSALRKTSISEAYTNTHKDITIPYDSIEYICAVTKDGNYIDIIRNGRFVLKGTEELNEPFDMLV